MPDYSLISTEGLTKPATVLIEKISSAVGMLWEPTQTRRMAQAQADAAMILAEGNIEIDELRQRAAQRFVEEETRKQQNMESIVGKAIQDVDSNAPTEKVDNDWIANFFDKCRSISDDDMQGLWSRILSGEANAPSSFSRKTVNLVADLDKASADLFHTLCSFGCQIDNTFAPLILDFREQIYRQHGLTLFELGELDSIGLIQIDANVGFALSELPKRITADYHDRSVSLEFPNEKDNSLQAGSVILTPSGAQLSRIVGPAPIDGFFEFLCHRWENESLIPSRKNRT